MHFETLETVVNSSVGTKLEKESQKEDVQKKEDLQKEGLQTESGRELQKTEKDLEKISEAEVGEAAHAEADAAIAEAGAVTQAKVKAEGEGVAVAVAGAEGEGVAVAGAEGEGVAVAVAEGEAVAVAVAEGEAEVKKTVSSEARTDNGEFHVPDIPKRFRMGRRGYSCSIRSLYALNGTKVFRRMLSISQMAKALGRDYVFLMYPFGQRNRFIGLLCHSDDRDLTGIVYVRRVQFEGMLDPPVSVLSAQEDPVSLRSKLNPYWKFQRFILGLKDDHFFKDGHCVAVWPLFDGTPYLPPSSTHGPPSTNGGSGARRWAIRDPWRADGKAVYVNENQLDLLIAGSWFVVYRSLV